MHASRLAHTQGSDAAIRGGGAKHSSCVRSPHPLPSFTAQTVVARPSPIPAMWVCSLRRLTNSIHSEGNSTTTILPAHTHPRQLPSSHVPRWSDESLPTPTRHGLIPTDVS